MAITKIPAAGFTGNNFRNIIINGDMSIAQRGTSATGLGNGEAGYHTVDRWRFTELGSPTFEFTMSQSTDVPTGQGFVKSLKLDCTTAQTDLGTGDHLFIGQKFEGQNLQYLKKGTANAESLTLSFWVKSNKTGTYTVYLYDNDNNRLISAAYTINSANTWEKKTITYASDTSGILDNDNADSLAIYFNLALGTDRTSGTLATSWEDTVSANLGVGQVNLADNTANEFYITGVQLEAGTTASDFEFLPHDVNLNRCLRYYHRITNNSSLFSRISPARGITTTRSGSPYQYPIAMRTSPSLDTTGTFSDYKLASGGSNITCTAITMYSNVFSGGSAIVASLLVDTAGSLVANNGYEFTFNNVSGLYLGFDAEL